MKTNGQILQFHQLTQKPIINSDNVQVYKSIRSLITIQFIH